MPRHNPNELIAQRRRQLPSPARPGQWMSRRELADTVNAALQELYPGQPVDSLLVDDRWIGLLERGNSCWPRTERRAALRRVFNAETDAELGLTDHRPTGESEPAPARTVDGGLDPLTAHPARRYNYWLGGKDNFAADRASGDLIRTKFPTVVNAAHENRKFLYRAVTVSAREGGIDQFLDIGCGLPLPVNTHNTAQTINPAARIMYVDNDPLVMAHARALLTGNPDGRTGYLEADLRDPVGLLNHPSVNAVLDLTRPVAVLLVAVLHFIHDHHQAVTIVRGLVDALPAGSHLVISNATMDFNTPDDNAAYEEMLANRDTDARTRTRNQFAEFFTGTQLLDPGIVAVSQWRPDPAADGPPPPPHEVAIYAGVACIA
uniref:SAM-dependent methyltransferase n=1 Tax=Paractinoplanes polyasparticus TaxID=2856853 RepID=UPI002107B052|nr:SAM-dependent methyltransferase [Actinoplanes polyasparticus]